MIFLFVSVKVTPKKRFEFEQTMESLMEDLRTARGCLDYSVFRDYKNPNTFCIINKWQEKINFINHIKTDSFGILMGAIANLCEEDLLEITLTTSSQDLTEMELALRKQLSNTIHIKSEADIE